MAKMEYKFPDDDGRRQRAWVVDGKERERSACRRVIGVLEARPWVSGVKETLANEVDDQEGVDILMKIDPAMVELIGIRGELGVVPVQVKSNEKKQKKFCSTHRERIFKVKEGEHIFVLDGQDALDVIAADLTGQLVVLARLAGAPDEESVLGYLETRLGDIDLVQRYRENRDLIFDTKWYGRLVKKLTDAKG